MQGEDYNPLPPVVGVEQNVTNNRDCHDQQQATRTRPVPTLIKVFM